MSLWTILFCIGLCQGLVTMCFAFDNPKKFGMFMMRNMFIIAGYSILFTVTMFVANWKLTLLLCIASPIISYAGTWLLTRIKAVAAWQENWFTQYMSGIEEGQGNFKATWRGLKIKQPMAI